MKPAWTLPMLAALMAVPAYAGKIDVDTGERCFGADCFDGGFELPDAAPPVDDEPAAIDAAQLCETLATRVYELCLRNGDGDASVCVADRETALDRCENPEDHVEAPGPTPVVLGPTSSGVYRIPYADGTEVKVSFDYFKHNPPGRIDMHAKGGGDHAIVAAAAGTVRIIEDSRSESQHPWDDLRKGDCMNNFVWIEHDNGEWSKYSHMQRFSTTLKAGLSVGDRVDEGDYLGDEGKVGCAAFAHLHFEIDVPGFDSEHPFDPARPEAQFDPEGGGLYANKNSNRNRNPRICGIETVTFQDGESYTAGGGPGAIEPGEDEIVRHGMPIKNYPCLVRRGVLAGYQTVWVDFFEIDKERYVNVVMRPATGPWASRSDLDAEGFLAENARMKADGYRLSHLETYRDGDVRYAGIWEMRDTPAQVLYIGKSGADHQAEAERLSALGYRPRAISVVDDRGLEYSALWEKVSGGFQLRSTVTLPEYRALVSEFSADGYEVVAANAYETDDGPHIAAIWRPSSGKILLATDLGKAVFNDQRTAARSLGLKTVAVTAHEEDGRGKYTGVFHQ